MRHLENRGLLGLRYSLDRRAVPFREGGQRAQWEGAARTHRRIPGRAPSCHSPDWLHVPLLSLTSSLVGSVLPWSVLILLNWEDAPLDPNSCGPSLLPLTRCEANEVRLVFELTCFPDS